MIVWRVDPADSEPLFLQIVNSVKRAVATNRLRAGDRLPSVRELAKELVINQCSGCHSLEVILAQAKEKAEWEATVYGMLGERSQQGEAIIRYLEEHFGH